MSLTPQWASKGSGAAPAKSGPPKSVFEDAPRGPPKPPSEPTRFTNFLAAAGAAKPAQGGAARFEDGRFTMPASAPAAPTVKYTYTRDELLALAVPSALAKDAFSSDTPAGIVQETWLPPVLLAPFDSEEVYNSWYEALTNEGRTGRRGNSGGEVNARMAPPRVQPAGRAWDARAAPARDDAHSILPSSGGMGLDKLSAATEQFRLGARLHGGAVQGTG